MPFIDTTGRNQSLTSYTFRGLAFLVGIIVPSPCSHLRYTGTFDKTVPVTATLKGRRRRPGQCQTSATTATSSVRSAA